MSQSTPTLSPEDRIEYALGQLEQADLLIGEILEDYFEDQNCTREAWAREYLFDRTRIKSEILFNCLIGLRNTLEGGAA